MNVVNVEVPQSAPNVEVPQTAFSRALAQVLIWLVRAWQVGLSPFLGSSCRFHPSCSAYAAEALERHGAWRGCRLTVRRLSRCHPFHEGGLDPVP
jgi:putative membrane protein insertion efficiency factor